MKDEDKTKEQLIEELNESRFKVKRLRELKHLHQIQLEVAGQAVIMTDLDGKITLFSGYAEKMYGWSAEEAAGYDAFDLLAGDNPGDQCNFDRETIRESEQLVRRKDGSTFRAMVKCVPVHDATHQLIATMILSRELISETDAEYDESLEEKDRLLAAYHAIGQAILSSLDLEQVLDTLPRQVLTAGIFRSLLVALVDEEKHAVEVVRGFSSFSNDVLVPGSTAVMDNREILGTRYDLDDSNVIAEVARTGKMIVIDGWDESRFDARVPRKASDINRVSYFLPVKRGSRVLAVLATSSVPEARDVVLRRIEIMNPLLDQVAIALEHARLYDEIRQTVVERTRAEETLRSREEFLQKVLNSSLNGIFIYDLKEEKYSYINRQFQTIAGWSLEEIRKMDAGEFSQLFHPDEVPVIADHIEQLSHGTDSDSVELVYQFKTKDGRMLCFLSRSSIFERDDKGNVRQIIGTFLDITERRRMEEDLRKNQNLESLGFLAGGIAHDFNNVLTSIMGGLSVLSLRVEKDGFEREMIDLSTRAALQAGELAQQLLTFAKGGAPVKEIADMGELLRETADLSLRGSRTKSEYRLQENLWPANVDKGQISQVIRNLVLNADQAMPQGGILTIYAENIDIPDENRYSLSPGPHIKVSVIDRGVGMTADIVKKVFDPYFTTKTTGHGLGLSIAHSVIQKHDGYIEAHSESGKGTRFDFYLPADDKYILEAPHIEERPESGAGRILLMDDEEMIHESVGSMLKELGYEVESAFDGTTAVEAYETATKDGRSFDVVIMDLTVPGGVGGKEAVIELHKIAPDARVIVSSGYAHDPILANYEDYGFSEALVKPVILKNLADKVKQVITEH